MEGEQIERCEGTPPSGSNLDWSQVEIGAYVPRRVSASELAPLDTAKMVVISRLLRKSMASIVQTAIYTYIQRTWAAQEERLIVAAKIEGCTPEEMFTKLLSGEK